MATLIAKDNASSVFAGGVNKVELVEGQTRFHNRTWLEKEYSGNKLSIREIAKICKVGPTTIGRWLERFNIPRRHSSDIVANYKEKEWLEEQYWENGLSTPDMAEMCGTTQSVIYSWMVRLDIPIRSFSAAHALKHGNHVALSSRAMEFLDGELLGDGYLQRTSPYAASYQMSSKYREYLDWQGTQMLSFGIKPGSTINIDKTDWGIVYKFRTLTYHELKPIRERWYPRGKKHVPKDLELHPLVVRQWYIGDGSLTKRSEKAYRVTLCTHGFELSEVVMLQKLLEDKGIFVRPSKDTNTGYSLRGATEPAKALLDYIGPCPFEIEHIYGYKWALSRGQTYG